MFDLDKWQEIFTTIRQNKLRTFLTGFSVGWGIFMLILLLGSGKGLENGITLQFGQDAINSIRIWTRETSIPYQGLKEGRRIQMENDDYGDIKDNIEGVEFITGRFYIPGQVIINRGSEYGTFNIRAVHPDHKHLEKSTIIEGRYLNPTDLSEYRKVCVIGRRVKTGLWDRKSPIGDMLEVNGIAFKVVGVFEESKADQREEEVIYLPITTAQRTFNGKNRINQMLLTIGDLSVEESIALGEDIRTYMSQKHRFDPRDRKAMRVDNQLEEFQEIKSILFGISIFVWFIASGTLIAGMIGVSNIMIIVVKERTKEIGIRKALGATPRSIISLIMQESVFITVLAGFSGLLGGMLLLEFYNSGLWLDIAQQFDMMTDVDMEEMGIFHHPEVDLGIAIQAMTFLVLAGTIAGWVPARRAASIKPIEALRDE
ncbi:MAG: ABC transporter permease [Bacteroidota bacterium]